MLIEREPLFDLADRLLGVSHRVVVSDRDSVAPASRTVPGPGRRAQGFTVHDSPKDRCTEYAWFEPVDER